MHIEDRSYLAQLSPTSYRAPDLNYASLTYLRTSWLDNAADLYDHIIAKRHATQAVVLSAA